MANHLDDHVAGELKVLSRRAPTPPWWLSGIIGSAVIVLVSLPRLLRLGAGGALNSGWYTTASGRRLNGLILDQVQYLQSTDHFSGRAPVIGLQPFTARGLAPWLAGHLGGDAAVSVWIVNVLCLALGTFALARLAMDLTAGRRDWTLIAVLVWSASWPVFWYTGNAYVDPAAVGLMTCALLALYRRWLLPGLVILGAAVWAKETALILVPLAVARELLVSTGSRVGRALRAACWVVFAAAAYLGAEWLVGGHDSTFASWLPSSIASTSRLFALNLTTPARLVSFALTAAPALLGVFLWWRSRRSHASPMPDADAVPLVVGVATAVAMAMWTFITAVWDGRTIWMSLPFGALLIAGWGARRTVRIEARRTVRTVLVLGAVGVVGLVLWTAVAGLVDSQIKADTAAPLREVQPRFMTADKMATPVGRTSFSGDGDGSIDVDADGPVLLRFSADERVQLLVDDAPLLSTPAREGTVLIDIDAPTSVAVSTGGAWTADVLGVDRAVYWEGLSAISGHGPQVLVFPGGLYTSTDLQIEGDTNLRVRLVGRCRLGTCGELAPTDGDQNVTLPAGTEAIVIDTAGEWNLLPESVSGEDTAEVLPETVHG